MKNKLMNMPMWKAFLIALLAILSISVIAETIFVHGIFNLIGHAIVGFEKSHRDDLNDVGEMDQAFNCSKYQDLLRLKDSRDKYDQSIVKDYENQLKTESKLHQFNLTACEQEIKSKKEKLS
jgi:c-di-GMP-related signal transduction protein